MQKLNVVLLVGGYPSDNDKAKGIFNQQAAKGLADKTNLTVIHIRGWRPGRAFYRRENYKCINVIRVRIPRIPSHRTDIQWLNDQIFLKVSWIIFRKFLKNIDIIHSVFITYGGLIGSYWKYKLNDAIIHITELIGSDVNNQLPKYLKSYKYSFWPSNIDGILANSNDLKRTIKVLLPKSKKISVAYKGIDLNKFNSLTYTPITDESCFNILFLGGFPAYKGFKYGPNVKGGITLMEAWEILEKEVDISNVVLNIGGPESDTHFVRNWINNLNNPTNIKLLGYMSPEVVPYKIAQADVVVIPSMQEGLPNLLLEACLLETPVIASNVGGIPEVIKDQVNGFLINPGDSQGLANQIKKVIRHSHLSEISSRARQNITQNFDAKNFIRDVMVFYNLMSK